MLIHKKVGLNLEKENIISFVGGGGKSTSIDVLAKELKSMGKKVLVTTTTVLFHPQHKDNDKFILGVLPEEYEPEKGTITLLGKTMDDEKIRGIDPKAIEEIYNRNIFDIILIEADGARMKPITAPAAHEPAVPAFTMVTIGVIGLDSIGKSLDEDNAHRTELLRKIFNVEDPHIINDDDIVKLILNENGLFKNSYGRKIVFLNKADREELILVGSKIREKLDKKHMKNIHITNIKENIIY